MNGKVARLQDLLADGWDVEDLVSDHGAIEVLLRRGASRATVVLDREDAEEVLLGDGLGTFAGTRRAALLVGR